MGSFDLNSIVKLVSWLGATVFLYFWVVRVGNLRDEGKSWFDALIKKNESLAFGIIGLTTMIFFGFIM